MVKDGPMIAVLFDLEDTLVETPWADHQHVLEFRRKTREKLTQLGIPCEVLEGVERATIMRNKASEYTSKNFTRAERREFNRRMEEFLCHYELDSARRSKLFPETTAALERLKRHQVKMGLVTNTSAKAVNIVSRLHGLKSYFNVVVTRENVKKLKPDPEGILFAVKKLGEKKFFMVGDLILDVLATKRAGGISILVRRHAEEPDEQQLLRSIPAEVLEESKRMLEDGVELNADYVVQSLVEVPSIVLSGLKGVE